MLRGGILRPLPEFDGTEANHEDLYRSRDLNMKLKGLNSTDDNNGQLDLGLTFGMPPRMTAGGRVNRRSEKRRQASPPSDESETTTLDSSCEIHDARETKLLRLFF